MVKKLAMNSQMLKKSKKHAHEKKIKNYTEELKFAEQKNDMALAWKLDRKLCAAYKGSRRNFVNFPKTHPLKHEVVEKYKKKLSMEDGVPNPSPQTK